MWRGGPVSMAGICSKPCNGKSNQVTFSYEIDLCKLVCLHCQTSFFEGIVVFLMNPSYSMKQRIRFTSSSSKGSWLGITDLDLLLPISGGCKSLDTEWIWNPRTWIWSMVLVFWNWRFTCGLKCSQSACLNVARWSFLSAGKRDHLGAFAWIYCW